MCRFRDTRNAYHVDVGLGIQEMHDVSFESDLFLLQMMMDYTVMCHSQ